MRFTRLRVPGNGVRGRSGCGGIGMENKIDMFQKVEDFNKLPISNKLNVYYTSCICTEDFSQKIINQLKGVLKPTKREEIIISIYMSLHLWLQAAIALNNTKYFQTLAAIARSIFEHLLDIKLIVDNKVENAIEKFEAFRKIDRFRMAKESADFVKEHPNAKIKVFQKRIEVASNKELEEKTKKLKLLWGDSSKKIKYWSGLDIKTRAQKAGIDYEKLYYEVFISLSWHIHSGLVGTREMTKEGLELVHVNSMRLIHEMFVDIILLVAKELKLDIAVVEFNELIQTLKLIPGFAVLEEEKKYLDELEKKEKIKQ